VCNSECYRCRASAERAKEYEDHSQSERARVLSSVSVVEQLVGFSNLCYEQNYSERRRNGLASMIDSRNEGLSTKEVCLCALPQHCMSWLVCMDRKSAISKDPGSAQPPESVYQTIR
jgi:hypothetical protein